MQDSSYHNLLPTGLGLGKPLGETPRLGRVFEATDRRGSDKHPVARVVRILDTGQGESSWRERVLERAQRLSENAIPFVSVPLEVGGLNEVVYLVFDKYDERIWDKLQEGLPTDDATRLFRQVLTGLAGLHDRQIQHGDVRSRNVYVSRSPSGRQTAFLTDAVIGPVTVWTGGALRDDDAARRYPPEWQGQTRPPSFRADLYALGLAACELYLGRDVFGKNNSSQLKGNAADVQLQLRRARVPWSVRKLIKSLLAEDPEERPTDAAEALAKLERWETIQHWRIPVAMTAAVAVVLLLLSLVIARSSSRNLAAAHVQELTSQKKSNDARYDALVEKSTRQQREQRESVRAKDQQIQAADNQIAKLQAEVSRLRKGPGQGTPSPTTTAAAEVPLAVRTAWTKHLATSRGKTTAETLRNLVVENAHTADRSLLGFVKKLRDLYNKPLLANWLAVDQDLAALVDESVESPWFETSVVRASQRYDDLETAKQEWRRWADPKGATTWDSILLRLQTDKRLSESVLDILGRWSTAIADSNRGWTVRLKKGECVAGYQTHRIVTVLWTEDGAKAWGKREIDYDYLENEWSSETAHDYTTTPKERDIQIKWRPGQPFGIRLEQDGNATNPDIVAANWDSAIGGPLAMWYANHVGVTKSTNGKLTFEIVDCPGPPPSVFKQQVPSPEKLISGK